MKSRTKNDMSIPGFTAAHSLTTRRRTAHGRSSDVESPDAIQPQANCRCIVWWEEPWGHGHCVKWVCGPHIPPDPIR